MQTVIDHNVIVRSKGDVALLRSLESLCAAYEDIAKQGVNGPVEKKCYHNMRVQIAYMAGRDKINLLLQFYDAMYAKAADLKNLSSFKELQDHRQEWDKWKFTVPKDDKEKFLKWEAFRKVSASLHSSMDNLRRFSKDKFSPGDLKVIETQINDADNIVRLIAGARAASANQNDSIEFLTSRLNMDDLSPDTIKQMIKQMCGESIEQFMVPSMGETGQKIASTIRYFLSEFDKSQVDAITAPNNSPMEAMEKKKLNQKAMKHLYDAMELVWSGYYSLEMSSAIKNGNHQDGWRHRREAIEKSFTWIRQNKPDAMEVSKKYGFFEVFYNFNIRKITEHMNDILPRSQAKEGLHRDENGVPYIEFTGGSKIALHDGGTTFIFFNCDGIPTHKSNLSSNKIVRMLDSEVKKYAPVDYVKEPTHRTLSFTRM